MVFTFVVISQINYFGFGFTTVISKPLFVIEICGALLGLKVNFAGDYTAGAAAAYAEI